LFRRLSPRGWIVGKGLPTYGGLAVCDAPRFARHFEAALRGYPPVAA